MIDKELEEAAKELRGVVSEITPPPYKRPRPQHRVLYAAASIVVAVSAGASLFLAIGPASEVPVPSSDGETAAGRESNGEPIGLTGSDPVSIRELDMPTPGSPVEETDFGTSIEAVTSSKESEAIQIPLQIRPAWNSDGSYYIVYEAGSIGSGHVLYDGQTNKRVNDLDIAPVDIEQVYWHPVNPTLLYYVDGTELIEYEVEAGAATSVHSFAGCESVDGAGSLRISHQTLELGQLCTTPEGNSDHVSVNVETSEERQWESDGFGAPQPTPSSGRYVAQNENGLVGVFDQNGDQTGIEFLIGTDGYVVLETSDGRDLLVTVVYSEPEDAIGSVVTFDLDTGSPTVVIGPSTGYAYPPSGYEIGTSVSNDGRIVFTTETQNSGEEPDAFEAELVLVDFDDPTPVARRLAHHRNSGSQVGSRQLWNGVYPSLHPTDSRVLFGSDWGRSAVNSYIVGG